MADTEAIEQLAGRLVIGRKRDGRSVYDAQAKDELVQASRQPGVSLSKLARQCGINANQLSRWARESERKKAQTPAPTLDAGSAFVPVTITAAAAPADQEPLALEVRLPNGIALDLRCDLEQAGHLLNVLGSLPCSASTRS